MYKVKPFNDGDTISDSALTQNSPMYPMKNIQGSQMEVDQSSADFEKIEEELIAKLKNCIIRADKELAKYGTQASPKVQETSKKVPNKAQTTQTPQKAPQKIQTSKAPQKTQAPKPYGTMMTSSAKPVIADSKIAWPDVPYPIDIVIATRATEIPMFPWTMKRLLGYDVVRIYVHRHSSDKGDVKLSLNFDKPDHSRSGTVKLIFTIILKNVQCPEISIHPCRHVKLNSEANLVRLILRLLPVCPEQTPYNETQSDYILDFCRSPLRNAADAQRLVETALVKQKFLVADKPSKADFLVFGLVNGGHIQNTKIVSQWQERLLSCYA